MQYVTKLDSSFSQCKTNYKILTQKIKKNPSNDRKLHLKIKLLISSMETLSSEIEDIIIDLDKEKLNLSQQDIQRLADHKESNDIFKKFLPFMLNYKILKDY